MGLKSLAVGGVGEDMMGDWVLQRVASFGVDISALRQIKGARTSSSIVCTRPDGTRPALHMKGATGDFVVENDLLDQVTDATVVHLGGVGLMDAMDGAPNAELMRQAKLKGAITTVDVFAGSPSDLPDVAAVLPYTDFFMPSDEEAMALTGYSDIEDTAKFFLDRGVGCCVFTLGSNGAYYRHRDGTSFRVPAFEIAVKCTCGCGDAFNAGFAVGLVRGFDPETIVRFARQHRPSMPPAWDRKPASHHSSIPMSS
jgi:sugar/nucleoside kinase (ribokinase family)